MRPTKEGGKFVLAALLIAVAAVNTGNNLIYLILSMMLATLAVSVLALRMNMKGLALEASFESPLFAGERANIGLIVTNLKKYLPSYSLGIYPPYGKIGGVIPYVAPSSEVSSEVSVVFPKRGVYRYGGFSLESGFPFIFFRKRLEMPLMKEVVVYPEMKEISLPALYSSGYGESPVVAGDADEMLFIREFKYGDAMKKISWKATAKAARLMVREPLASESKKVSIILDNVNPGEEAVFEKAVSFAASLAGGFIKDGLNISLISFDGVMPFGGGTGHLFDILYSLAVIKEHAAPGFSLDREDGGVSLVILMSRGSSLARLASECDMVVYAEDL